MNLIRRARGRSERGQAAWVAWHELCIFAHQTDSSGKSISSCFATYRVQIERPRGRNGLSKEGEKSAFAPLGRREREIFRDVFRELSIYHRCVRIEEKLAVHLRDRCCIERARALFIAYVYRVRNVQQLTPGARVKAAWNYIHSAQFLITKTVGNRRILSCEDKEDRLINF